MFNKIFFKGNNGFNSRSETCPGLLQMLLIYMAHYYGYGGGKRIKRVMGMFINLPFNNAPYVVIQRIKVWGARWTHVWSDVIMQILDHLIFMWSSRVLVEYEWSATVTKDLYWGSLWITWRVGLLETLRLLALEPIDFEGPWSIMSGNCCTNRNVLYCLYVLHVFVLITSFLIAIRCL